MPSNEGSFRPIPVIAPLGAIFNPKAPAAAEARFTQCNMMIDLIINAVAPVLPDEIIAGSSASISFASYAGVKPDGNYWVFLEVNERAYGGRPRSDGPDGIDNLMANTPNDPLEYLPMHIPMICERYELRDDVAPGAGRFRGGIGVVKAQRILTDDIITHESERQTNIPWGIFGGKPGAAGKCSIYEIGGGEVREMPSKFHGLDVRKNDVMAYYSPCRGGYGSPLERDPARVLADVLDGFCSPRDAADVYGVVLDLDAETVDLIATEQRRAQMDAL